MLKLFVCEMCYHLDAVELAYAEWNFSAGPPAPWRCTTCQYLPWHNQFPRQRYTNQPVVNRAQPGTTISLG